MLDNSISPEIFPLTAEKSHLFCRASSSIFSLALKEHLLVNTSRCKLISSPENVVLKFLHSKLSVKLFGQKGKLLQCIKESGSFHSLYTQRIWTLYHFFFFFPFCYICFKINQFFSLSFHKLSSDILHLLYHTIVMSLNFVHQLF